MARERVTGGISGAGGSNVNPTYKETRMADAIKKVTSMDPVVKQKLKDMYPKTTKETIVKNVLGPKKNNK